MEEKTVQIQCKDGLDAGITIFFIQKATGFQSQIRLIYKDVNVNAKSLLGVLSLNIRHKDWITLTADDPDEQKALDVLVSFLTKMP